MTAYIIILYYLAAANAAAFLAYGIDKLRARRSRRRIPERTLLLLAAAGGSAGAWLGMRVWRHKTRHRKFRYGVPLLLALHIALALLLLARTGRAGRFLPERSPSRLMEWCSAAPCGPGKCLRA